MAEKWWTGSRKATAWIVGALIAVLGGIGVAAAIDIRQDQCELVTGSRNYC